MNLVSNYFRRKAIAENTQLATNVDEEWIKSEKAQKIKKWITYYRRNWEQYVEDVLQIHLYDIQKYKIHMMGIADVYWDVSTRGVARKIFY